jgi:hypothetical protein
MLPGWFAGSESLRQSYCAAAAVSRTLAEALRHDDLSDADAFEKLIRMHARTSALLASLAVKLRLCPSTNTDRGQPKRAPGRRPCAWNMLLDQPWKIMSIARREWAEVGHSI